MKLTRDQLNNFEKDGYLVAGFVFDDSLLGSTIRELASRHDQGEYKNRHPGTRVQDA